MNKYSLYSLFLFLGDGVETPTHEELLLSDGVETLTHKELLLFDGVETPTHKELLLFDGVETPTQEDIVTCRTPIGVSPSLPPRHRSRSRQSGWGQAHRSCRGLSLSRHHGRAVAPDPSRRRRGWSRCRCRTASSRPRSGGCPCPPVSLVPTTRRRHVYSVYRG